MHRRELFLVLGLRLIHLFRYVPWAIITKVLLVDWNVPDCVRMLRVMNKMRLSDPWATFFCSSQNMVRAELAMLYTVKDWILNE